jgi:hypothetical protein
MNFGKKKTILISFLIGSIICGVVILTIIIIFRKETSPSQSQNQPGKPNPQKPKNPPLPEENDDCPYTEKLLTEQSIKEKLAIWKQIPRDYVLNCEKKVIIG